jgi:hypothetical protein
MQAMPYADTFIASNLEVRNDTEIVVFLKA